jgi:hypothetical protein
MVVCGNGKIMNKQDAFYWWREGVRNYVTLIKGDLEGIALKVYNFWTPCR